MTRWVKIKLDPESLNRPRRETIQGSDIETFLSPYDVPESVIGNYSSEAKTFTIEFSYLSSGEPVKPVRAGAVTLWIGENSSRLYKMQLSGFYPPTHSSRISEFLSAIDQGTAILSAKRERNRRLGNYQVAKEVIAERGKELLEELTTQ